MNSETRSVLNKFGRMMYDEIRAYKRRLAAKNEQIERMKCCANCRNAGGGGLDRCLCWYCVRPMRWTECCSNWEINYKQSKNKQQ